MSMATGSLRPVLQYLRRAAALSQERTESDRQLLARFVLSRDESAFSTIVNRHGSLVFGVCRRVVGNTHDAEDAFQATFLVLARKAASLKKPDLLANWLYGVALRTARKARGHLALRHFRETPLMDIASTKPADGDAEVGQLLDEELRRLPARYRVPIVLCYLEGKTHAQAAKLLGCPRETISTRMARGRERLKRGLIHRGVAPVAAGLVLSSQEVCSAALPPALAHATIQAALLFAAGHTVSGAISSHVFLLTKEVLRTMMITKCIYACVLTLTLGIVATGTGLAWQAATTARPSEGESEVSKSSLTQQRVDNRKLEKPGPKEDPPKPAEAKIDTKIRAGQWRDMLEVPVTLQFLPNTPFGEAIAQIADRYNLAIFVDNEAFKADLEQPDVENQPVKLAGLANIRLRTVLPALLQQVAGDYYIKDNVLMVVPRKQVESGVTLRQRVDVGFEKRSLAEALEKLADMTGVSIILDASRGPDPNVQLTADFRNVPLESAVRVLADMAGMKAVRMDNMIYVTSTGNAETLKHERVPKKLEPMPKVEKPGGM